jgi:isochorismate hydrolase
MPPNAPFVCRTGEVNAFDNPDFRNALKATGRKQVIIGALLTEVCRSWSHQNEIVDVEIDSVIP